MKVMGVCYDDDGAQKHGLEKSTWGQNSHLCSLCMHEKNDLHICNEREDLQDWRKHNKTLKSSLL